MGFFDELCDLVSGVVEVAGTVAKGTVEVATGLTAELTEAALGPSQFTSAVRDLSQGISAVSGMVVDGIAQPLATAVGTGMVRSAERMVDLGTGVATGLLSNDPVERDQGFSQAGNAAVGLAVTVAVGAVTAGVLGHIAGTAAHGAGHAVAHTKGQAFGHAVAQGKAHAVAHGAAHAHGHAAANGTVAANPNLHYVQPHHVSAYTRTDGTHVASYWRDGDGTTAVDRLVGYLQHDPTRT